MRITVLMENTCDLPQLGAEHGLSLWLEAAGHTLLFDSGASSLFAGNARALGVNLARADMAILSHGHYDHAGGLEAFFENNKKASLYLRKGALDPHLALHEGQKEDIGLNPDTLPMDRLVFTREQETLAPGIALFSGVEHKEGPLTGTALLTFQGGQEKPDDFDHEQHLVIEEAGTTLLVTGCAHMGILNILAHFKGLWGRMPDVVIGGFHLAGRGPGSLLSEAELNQLAKQLLDTGALFYTGHCTGDEPFLKLKARMQDKLLRLYGGSVIAIP